MLEFQQSEDTAVRRRWIIVLVSSTDGVTGLTGQTGQVYISKNGGTPALSTNSIVEVDSTNMPGHYYIELTASELDTLGHISITKKTASSLAFHDRAIVSYNDPYASAGGFSGGGSGETFKLTKKHIQSIAEEVWKYKVEEEISAQENDDYFYSRPVGSQYGAMASPQSKEIESREWIEQRVESLMAAGNPQRPNLWGGFRLVPERMEFWQGRPSRLHDRIQYERTSQGWMRKRLAP